MPPAGEEGLEIADSDSGVDASSSSIPRIQQANDAGVSSLLLIGYRDPLFEAFAPIADFSKAYLPAQRASEDAHRQKGDGMNITRTPVGWPALGPTC